MPGVAKGGGLEVRELAAESNDRGAGLGRLGGTSIIEGALDFCALSRLLSGIEDLSRGALPFRISFNLSGSSSKST